MPKVAITHERHNGAAFCNTTIMRNLVADGTATCKHCKRRRFQQEHERFDDFELAAAEVADEAEHRLLMPGHGDHGRAAQALLGRGVREVVQP